MKRPRNQSLSEPRAPTPPSSRRCRDGADVRPSHAHLSRAGRTPPCKIPPCPRLVHPDRRRCQAVTPEQPTTSRLASIAGAFAASSKLPAAQIRDLGALSWLHAGESVILFGPVGVGKSHVAQALGHLAVRQGAHVRFAKTNRILADLADGHADRTWDKRIRELARPDVLILDDCAMRQLNATQADDLYELVSERQGRSLIITSNRAPSD
ncbi:ATP-binding protein [Streptomyces sp. NPDC056930]|uniref:ATP-binding protein n=1 Tax=Streptomyces sp. NPDC056930 TaxID=3345967 RepID=UPI00363B49AB